MDKNRQQYGAGDDQSHAIINSLKLQKRKRKRQPRENDPNSIIACPLLYTTWSDLRFIIASSENKKNVISMHIHEQINNRRAREFTTSRIFSLNN